MRQAFEGAVIDQELTQAFVFLGRAVAPIDIVGIVQRRDLSTQASSLPCRVGTETRWFMPEYAPSSLQLLEGFLLSKSLHVQHAGRVFRIP